MNNKNLSFAFELPNHSNDPQNFYKKGIVEEILKIRKDYPGFTVAGIDDPEVRRGIECATGGSLMTVGTAKNHDVEWIERPNYAREKGYAPVLDLRKDWTKIVSRLKAYAEEHHGTTNVGLSNGETAIVHRNYVQIGYKMYSYGSFITRVTGETIKLSPADIERLYHSLK